MIKNYFFVALLWLCVAAAKGQVPVMNPLQGSTIVCWGTNPMLTYSTSASNSPTQYNWSIQPYNGTILIPQSANCGIYFPNTDGTYTVTCFASNGAGPSAPVSIVVTVFERPNVTFSGNMGFCQGSSTNLSASPTISSGSSTLFYSWAPPTGLNTTSGPVVMANPSVTTNYTVSVVNGLCQYTVPLTVSVFMLPNFSVSGNTLICENETSNLVASGNLSGTSTLFYNWGPAYGLNTTTGASVSATPSVSTVYTVSVNDGTCSAYKTLSVTVDPCVGLRELHGDEKTLFAYPNPNNGRFVVRSAETGNGTVVDQLGRTVRDLKFTAGSETEIEGLEAGVYFIVTSRSRLKIAVLR